MVFSVLWTSRILLQNFGLMCCTILTGVPTESWKLLYQVHWRTSQEVMLSQTLSCCCLGNAKNMAGQQHVPFTEGAHMDIRCSLSWKMSSIFNLMKTWNQKITSWKSERKIAAILRFCNITLDSWHMTQEIGCEKIYRNRNCDGTTPWKSLKPPFKSCFRCFDRGLQFLNLRSRLRKWTSSLMKQRGPCPTKNNDKILFYC